MSNKNKRLVKRVANTVSNQGVSPIFPDVLYPLRAFQIASGLGPSKIREARLAGIPLPVLKCGRRLYIKGSRGIAFIEAVAASPALNPSK